MGEILLDAKTPFYLIFSKNLTKNKFFGQQTVV